MPSYLGVHIYTLVQIITAVIIFIVTLTKGAPAFPVIIIALVPIRLLLMNKLWNRETLRFVDAWACREGTPEDDEDKKNGLVAEEGRGTGTGEVNGNEKTEVDGDREVVMVGEQDIVDSRV